jgi:transcriptional regulator with XRE-family HTH domain
MNAGELLRSAREHAGMTQGQLADIAGTSQATVSAYETGAKQPSLDTFGRLLAAMGARVAIEPARHDVKEPSRAELARASRTLAEVLALAEALPARRRPERRVPRLETARATS